MATSIAVYRGRNWADQLSPFASLYSVSLIQKMLQTCMFLQVLAQQGLGKYCDPDFVKAASREMAEAMDMTQEEFDKAAHDLMVSMAENQNRSAPPSPANRSINANNTLLTSPTTTSTPNSFSPLGSDLETPPYLAYPGGGATGGGPVRQDSMMTSAGTSPINMPNRPLRRNRAGGVGMSPTGPAPIASPEDSFASRTPNVFFPPSSGSDTENDFTHHSRTTTKL